MPVLFAGTALFLERRRGAAWAVIVAGAFAPLPRHVDPIRPDQYPNYEAHGLAIAAFANRILRWPDDTISNALVVVTVVSTALLLLLPWLRPASWRRASRSACSRAGR